MYLYHKDDIVKFQLEDNELVGSVRYWSTLFNKWFIISDGFGYWVSPRDILSKEN